MITAHLPAGYVVGRILAPLPQYGMGAALLGSILPDLDLLFFYFVDNRAIHHHRYWVHIPAFWCAVACLVVPVAIWMRRLQLAAIFFAAIAIHLLLDTINGGILWAAPVHDHLFFLINVPASQPHWILSYLLHWSIVFELIVWGTAVWLWRKGRRG